MPYRDVPVPEEHLPAVYELLARLQKGEEPDAVDDSKRLLPPEDSRDLVIRVYNESEPRHRALLELLAENKDEWVSSGQIIDALNLPGRKSIAGLFGAFGRRTNNRYGRYHPWMHEWDRERGEGRYLMRGEVAGWVREAVTAAGNES